jgi:hypothetical protein
MNAASAQDTAPSRIDNITKSARDMIPAMPAMQSISLPAMPDLSLHDFSDATGRVMTEFNTFTQQVGDALPILEEMGYEVTTFKVTWGLPPKARLRLKSVEGHADPLLLAPDNVTGNVRAVRLKDKVKTLGNVVGVGNIERRPRNGHVAD